MTAKEMDRIYNAKLYMYIGLLILSKIYGGGENPANMYSWSKKLHSNMLMTHVSELTTGPTL